MELNKLIGDYLNNEKAETVEKVEAKQGSVDTKQKDVEQKGKDHGDNEMSAYDNRAAQAFLESLAQSAEKETKKATPKQTKGSVKMKNALKVTMDGKLAARGKDGFYYSVSQQGTLKREHAVFKNVSDKIVTKERSRLNIGDMLMHNGELAFCSGDIGNQYMITTFADFKVAQVQKTMEEDELGDAYQVIINPLDSLLKSDPDVDVATLLGSRSENAEKIGLNLQIQHGKTLASMAEALQSLIGAKEEEEQ